MKYLCVLFLFFSTNVFAGTCANLVMQDALAFFQQYNEMGNSICEDDCTANPGACLGPIGTLSLDPNGSLGSYYLKGEYLSCANEFFFYLYYPNAIQFNCPGDHTPKNRSDENPNPRGRCGSIIQTSNQVLGEMVPVTGASFYLTYFSNRVIGKRGDYKIDIRISGDDLPANLTGIVVSVFDENTAPLSIVPFSPLPNQDYVYEWSTANVNSSSSWASVSRLFSTIDNYSGLSPGFSPPPIEMIKHVGNFRAIKLGIGGWLPSVWHFYDAGAKMLYKGDGSKRSVEAVQLPYTVPQLYRISNEDGSEVYEFDEYGKIYRTRLGLTGTIIYSFQYDSADNLISITEPFSRVTTFNRDSAGKILSITSPNSKVTTLSLSTQGYLATITNPLGEIYSMTYETTSNNEGLLLTFSKPSGSVSTMTYDSDGNLLTDTSSSGYLSSLFKEMDGSVSAASAMGLVTTNLYDSSTLSEIETRPSGYIYSSSRSPFSLYDIRPTHSLSKNWVMDPRFGEQSRVLTNSVDNSFGYRSTDIVHTLAPSTITDPFTFTSLTSEATIGLAKITSVYTSATKKLVTTSKLLRTFTSYIDTYERQISKQRGTLTATAYTYVDNLLTKITQGVRETNFTYDATTKLLSSITNPLSQVTSFTYDSAERLLTKTLPDSRVINYTYDSNGNLTSITPPSRPIHELDFGINEKLESYNPPLLAGVPVVNTLYSYDLDKQLTKIERPDGEDIDFNYDVTTGLLSTITGSFGTITNTYVNELPLSITDQNGSLMDFVYTGVTPTTMTLTRLGTTPLYEFSRTPSTTFPGKIGSEVFKGLGAGSVTRTINYTYDNDELLKKVGDLNLVFNVPNGLLTQTTLGTIKDAYGYNAFGELISYNVKYGTTIIYEYTLTRDSLGRISQKIETLNGVISTYDYTYDSAGRLTQVNKNGVASSIYGYDNNSNRISGSIRGETTAATYDNQDRLTDYNGTARTYNANGELLTSGTKSLVYDVFGNLKSHASGSTTINYEVDPLQRRMGRLVGTTLSARYMYNPEGQLVGELNNLNKLAKTFVYGTKNHVPDYYVDSSNNKFRIITDNLGSVRLVVSSAGVVSQLMEHDEFGRVLQDTNPGLTPFGFAGGVYDSATGLVRFGVRDYDPLVGRWLSKDPIRFDGGDTNLYGYVLQDPVNFIDPEGKSAISAGIGDIFKQVREALKFKKNLEKLQDKLLCKFNSDLCKDGRKPDQNPLPPEDPNEDARNACQVGGVR